MDTREDPFPPPFAPDAPTSSEVLILPDGRLLAHNISPVLARVLARLES